MFAFRAIPLQYLYLGNLHSCMHTNSPHPHNSSAIPDKWGNLQSPINLHTSLGCGRKPDHLGETYLVTEPTCTLHTGGKGGLNWTHIARAVRQQCHLLCHWVTWHKHIQIAGVGPFRQSHHSIRSWLSFYQRTTFHYQVYIVYFCWPTWYSFILLSLQKHSNLIFNSAYRVSLSPVNN